MACDLFIVTIVIGCVKEQISVEFEAKYNILLFQN